MRWKKATVLLLLVGTAVQATPMAERDSDGDGIPDLFDFCPGVANTVGPDRDHDRIRDGCDLEPDGDGRLRVPFTPVLSVAGPEAISSR